MYISIMMFNIYCNSLHSSLLICTLLLSINSNAPFGPLLTHNLHILQPALISTIPDFSSIAPKGHISKISLSQLFYLDLQLSLTFITPLTPTLIPLIYLQVQNLVHLHFLLQYFYLYLALEEIFLQLE